MELLVRIVDKPRSGNAALDAMRTTAGDVIAIAPDGHVWGKAEVSNPEWRIIKVPGLSRQEAEALVSGEMPVAFGGNRLLRKRGLRLDLDALDALEGIDTRGERTATRKSHDHVVKRDSLATVRALKKPLPDPRIIGPRRGVIG